MTRPDHTRHHARWSAECPPALRGRLWPRVLLSCLVPSAVWFLSNWVLMLAVAIPILSGWAILATASVAVNACVDD